jgi:hypothetical protein
MKIIKYDQSDKEKAASKRGRRSRRKGAQFERDIVNLFKAILPEGFDAWRGLQSKGGGCNPDVAVRGSQTKEMFLHCELKKGKAPNPRKAYHQAFCDSQPGTMPIAVTQKDREAILVTMRWQDFTEMLTAYLNNLEAENG